MTIGERLREERERLGMSQPAFAALAGTTKQTLFSWESGKTAPDGLQLAALGTHEVDILYVVMGVRDPGKPALDVAEKVLLDSYRRCSPEGQATLVQTAALLAAGISDNPKKPTRKASSQASGDVVVGSQINTAVGAVQVGYAGGDVLSRKGR